MPRPPRIALAFLISTLAAAPPALAETLAGDLRLSEFSHEPLPGQSPSFSKKGDSVAKGFEALLAGRSLPIPCSSSLLLDLRRQRESLPYPVREALRTLTTRPAIQSDETRLSRDGKFTIHYTDDFSSPDAIESRDSDFNGVPDRIDQVEAGLHRAATVLGERLAWPLPATGPRTDRYDVFLVNLGPGRGGFTVPDREIPSTPQDDASTHIVIDSRLEGAQLSAAVIHQFAHASLLALSTRAPAWWTEATAAWLETQVTGDPASHRDAISRRLERLDLSLSGDSLLLSLGNYLWVSFLADRLDGGSDRVRRIWAEQSLRSGEPFLASLNETLKDPDTRGMEGAFREFTRWTLFTGSRDDGAHFHRGSLLPPITPRATHQVFPLESAGYEVVEPLGAAVYRLVGDGTRGGLKFRFEAAQPEHLEVDLVITSSDGGRHPHLVELLPDGGGRAEMGIPWRGVSEVMILVRNPALEGKPARFRYSAQMDPLFPYDLSSFTALPAPGGITLQWSTSREIDLLGWNVQRSSSPNGIFLKLNSVTLPSGGDSEEETDYIYQDTTALAGSRYFYVLEAITLQGLPDRSFPISARAIAPEPLP